MGIMPCQLVFSPYARGEPEAAKKDADAKKFSPYARG